jgi:probable rRNA maturation factor
LYRLINSIYKHEALNRTRRVSIVFCSDKVIQRLNAVYRHKDRATDVLSFEFKENDFLGEIFISLPRAAVQARRFHLGYGTELARLLTHGMFHLLGFDHTTKRERALMENKEARYWQKKGQAA